jgi:hypothetical protein
MLRSIKIRLSHSDRCSQTTFAWNNFYPQLMLMLFCEYHFSVWLIVKFVEAVKHLGCPKEVVSQRRFIETMGIVPVIQFFGRYCFPGKKYKTIITGFSQILLSFP